MQTERVTFLTTPDHKAALDAFAASSGRSVGHVVREATSRYIEQPAGRDRDEEALELALPEIEAAFAQMGATIETMRATIADACAAVDLALAGDVA
jgi:glutathione S-transferase